jgi:hypothetical protein
MAAPFVAGLAALLLEQDPSLTGPEVRDLLSITTFHDDHTNHGSLYAPCWGFGKLYAPNALRVSAGTWGVGLDPAQSLCGAAKPWLAPDGVSTLLVAFVPRDASGLPLGPGLDVEVQARGAGFAGAVQDLQNGIYVRRLIGTGRRGTDAVLSCSANGVQAHASPTVRLAASYHEMSGKGVVGGACHCAHGLSAGTALYLVLVLLLLTRAGRISLMPSRKSR